MYRPPYTDEGISGRLNGSAPNSHGRRVWFLARTSLNVKGQRSRSPGTKTCCALPSPPAATEWNALAANNVTQHQTGPFRRCGGGVISAACVRFVFGKTSLALVSLQFRRDDVNGFVQRNRRSTTINSRFTSLRLFLIEASSSNDCTRTYTRMH